MSLCDRCGDKGLIRVKYQQEDGYDIAVCVCSAGQWWRHKGMLRGWTDMLTGEKPRQIGRLEEFESGEK